MQTDGRSLNQTFIPKTILRKTQTKNTNPLLQKNSFQKTHGNIYVQLDPPQIKFNGYEINKINSLSFKIINKAPISQRFNIIPPSQTHFSIKVNKKGNVPTGMYQTVQVFFKATDYKYLYDVVKINTQTQNFVVPLYAYPSIPNLNMVFPKLIDFGNIQLLKTQSFVYPINNPTPIDYSFEFLYKKQCSEIMINPLNGIIPGNGETIIQIAFIPNRKMTYSAQVYFSMKQFDFQPIHIQIMGSGKDKQLGKTLKRLKSSKLAPLKDKQEDQQKQKDFMNKTQSFLSEKMKEQKKSFQTNIRKINSRISYPKLLSSTMKQKTGKSQIQTTTQLALNQKSPNSSTFNNSQQRQFTNRYNKVLEIDRQKQIKFTEYLGDPQMNETQLQFQRSILQEMINFRNNLLRNQCQSRYNSQKNQYSEVEYKIVKPMSTTWDQNKNDLIYQRKAILNKFVVVASKVIQTRRIEKRFQKIQGFLRDCSTKQQVARKVEVSFQKSLDSHSKNAFRGEIDLQFNLSSLEPAYFELQFSEGKQQFSERTFQTQGKTQFDDLATLQMMQPSQTQKMAYSQVGFPPDFLQLNKLVPRQRVSGEEQFSVKSSSLPSIDPIELFDILGKAFQIPNHFFIHQKDPMPLFKQYKEIDERDPRYLFQIQGPIQDEFQGWSQGDFQVLKTKLLKNAGIQYNGSSSFNYSSYKNDIGFLGDITKNLPSFIQKPAIDDQISDDDSDDEKYQQNKRQNVQEFLQKIQANPQVKVRRQNKQVVDQDQKDRRKLQRNIGKDKLRQVTRYIQKVKNLNKMVDKAQNLLVL